MAERKVIYNGSSGCLTLETYDTGRQVLVFSYPLHRLRTDDRLFTEEYGLAELATRLMDQLPMKPVEQIVKEYEDKEAQKEKDA